MKPSQQRSGTVRCQRCYKFGHYTYECQNEVAYRYRPSRTVMYKQQIKMALNKDKGPQTIIRNPDKQRRIEDKASSEDEEQIKKQQQIIRKENQNRKADIKLQEKQKIGSNKKQDQQEDQQSSSSSSQSSSCSSSSSQSSISEDQDSDQVQDSVPQKKRKQ